MIITEAAITKRLREKLFEKESVFRRDCEHQLKYTLRKSKGEEVAESRELREQLYNSYGRLNAYSIAVNNVEREEIDLFRLLVRLQLELEEERGREESDILGICFLEGKIFALELL